MVINWQPIGIEVVRLMVSCLVSIVLGALIFRKYIAPELTAALEDAKKTSQILAGLGGIKKADLQASKNIEKAVARDIINEKIPELEALKVFLSPGTWEEIQETIDNNPEAVLQLWDKYGHLIGGLEGQEKTKLDF